MKPAEYFEIDIKKSAAPRGLQYSLRIPSALAARMRGPGGIYNCGNLLGLLVGMAVQLAYTTDGDVARALADYLARDVSALMLTLATLVFFVSGESYHRAWQNGFPPDKDLNRRGDLLSAIGALALGGSLLALGHPFLAATAGLLHAAGKFGSAVWNAGPASGVDWPWIFRLSVLASRIPAALVALIELAGHLPALAQGASALPAVMPATLLACYLFWGKADLMLFRH